MPSELEQQLAAVARQYTNGGAVDISIPLLRINGKIHPCGVAFQLDCLSPPEPRRDTERRRLVQVALMIRQKGNVWLDEESIQLFTRAGYNLRCKNLLYIVEAILNPEGKNDHL